MDKVKITKYYVPKTRRILFGMRITDGIVFKVIIYVLLISIGFVFILPVLKMASSSFKDLKDLLDPTVGYMPTRLYLENYKKALEVLNYKNVFFQSLYITLLSAVCQTISCAIIGYGFARFKFFLKNVFFVLALITFIIPPQVLMIPRYLNFRSLGLLGNMLSIALPAMFGQGIKSAIFILIFYQFFRMLPKALEEAAKIDGATNFAIFIKIAIPTATPSIIVSFIFSIVWYWNETSTISLYLGGKLTTLPLELSKFTATFEKLFQASESAAKINEGIKMSGTILAVLPVLVIYFVLQRWFVEGVDRSGITGE